MFRIRFTLNPIVDFISEIHTQTTLNLTKPSDVSVVHKQQVFVIKRMAVIFRYISLARRSDVGKDTI